MSDSVSQQYTVDTARHVLSIVDVGLSKGVGEPEPGKMCVEAAICYALELPHGDDPGCVASSVRAFKIRLNDSQWSSPLARAKGLRALAVAQLGSKDVVNDVQFSQRLAERTIRVIVPIALRKAGLEVEATRCEQEGTREAALAGKNAAYADAAAAADAAADAAERDRVLMLSASIALNILRELNAPGVTLWDAVNTEQEASS